MTRKKKRGRPKKRSGSKTKKKEIKDKRKRKEKEIVEKKPKLNIHPETKRGVITIILFAIAILFILSFQGIGGVAGDYILKFSNFIFGSCLWLIPIVLIVTGIVILRDIHKNIYLSTFLGMALFILSFLGLIQILLPILFPNETSKAGWLGYLISWPLIEFLGFWASIVIFSTTLIISILIAFNIPLRKPIQEKDDDEEDMIQEKISKEIKGIGFTPEKKSMSSFVKGVFKKPTFNTKQIGEDGITEEQEPAIGKTVANQGDDFIKNTAVNIKDYTFPPIELLEADKGSPSSGNIKANMNIIEKTLENFNIPVEMGEINVGPTVTQYTLRPASGVKLAKLTSLHRDISLALAAHPIRIEAPIPGRSLVGIEIPNKTKTLVRLRDLLTGFDYKQNGHYLNLALGRDVSGEPTWTNLVKMPHILIAGSTGSGKSIAIHSIVTSLLYQKSPWELKFILIDPKRVELPLYNGIPHLLTPVIVDLSKVVNAFKWAVREMEERYKLLSNIGAKDLASYNERISKINPKDILPYIVIVVDELADIMAAYGKEVEGVIVRLAQMSRAIGIHLVLSTQRPSVEVITGLIKANITSRIALQVASQVDSRTILDMSGAERLLGNGDMLFLAGDVGKPKRIQGVYVSEQEVKKIVTFLRKQSGEPEYAEEITEAVPGEQMSTEGRTVLFDDPLLSEVKDLVIKSGKASASYLQRRFRIGYARAASLLDMLEQQGMIGPSDGSKPRKVLVGTESNQKEPESFGDLDDTIKENMKEEGINVEEEEEKIKSQIPIPSKEEEDF